MLGGPRPQRATAYRLGSIAALAIVALSVVQVSIEVIGVAVLRIAVPQSVEGWFALIQANRLLGLAELTALQIPLFCLLALVFMGLRSALRHVAPTRVDAATVLGLIGITVYVGSNTALSIVSLADRYSAAAAPFERSNLLAAGEQMLAFYEGTGLNVGVPLVMVAIVLYSGVMWGLPAFGRLPAAIGFTATTGTLAYYLALPLGSDRIMVLEAAGAVFVVWVGLCGWRLWRLAGRRGISSSRRPLAERRTALSV